MSKINICYFQKQKFEQIQCRFFKTLAQLHANLKIGIKTAQPCRLNAIVPAGAKKHKKTLAFKLTFQIF